jgi:hypothetical protein
MLTALAHVAGCARELQLQVGISQPLGHQRTIGRLNRGGLHAGQTHAR